MKDMHASERPLVVGANHRSSSMFLRDRLMMHGGELAAFLGKLRNAGLNQALVISTEDRFEVVTVSTDCAALAPDLTRLLAERADIGIDEIGEQIYVKTDAEAVRHLFAVAASLDSVTVGESRILGQIHACHAAARSAGMTGQAIESMLDAAYGAAGRVQAETDIGRYPDSIAAAAIESAKDLHGDLAGRRGLLVGLGELGESVARHQLEAGLGDQVVTHSDESRAEATGQRLDCHTAAIDDLPQLLEEADIVVTAMNTRRYVVSAEAVQHALQARRRRPVFLLDTGVPGDVDPAVDRLEDAFLFTIDDLERVMRRDKAKRDLAARAAWEIVDAEAADFAGAAPGAGAHARTAEHATRLESLRAEALREAGGDADKATQILVQRLARERGESPPAGGAEAAPAESWLKRAFRVFLGSGDE